MFGLLEKDLERIRLAISSFVEIEKAVIFGLRAMGNHKKGSGVDIAISGKEISKVLRRLELKLNDETLMPYKFDVVDYASINNAELKEHIDSFGKEVYKKGVWN